MRACGRLTRNLVHYGTAQSGDEVEQYTLGPTPSGLSVNAMTYGATITAINMPNRHRRSENVVLHFDSLAEYEHQPSPRRYYGATIGRYANRIAGARFALKGKTYQLSANDGPNMLHGGARGFDSVVWRVEEANRSSVAFSHESPAGDQGFPGALRAIVTFTLADQSLRVDYLAQSSADTYVNLTNHSYFNLHPESGSAGDHVLQLFADAYTAVDDDLIPTGAIVPTHGTPYDFSSPRAIGAQIYDTNWVLREPASHLRDAAMLGHPASGRVVQVLTTEPGVQIYTGNRQGVAIETQHFPDSPHHPHFPSTLLRAGERYSSTTLYRFSLSA